jgi:glucose 1-dehydrogenase
MIHDATHSDRRRIRRSRQIFPHSSVICLNEERATAPLRTALDSHSPPPSVTAPLVDLVDRSVLVTGASSGIGRATVIDLIARGARVAVNYPSADEAPAAHETLHRAAEALSIDAGVAASVAGGDGAPPLGTARIVPDGSDARLIGADGIVLGFTVRADVSDPDAVEAMIERVTAEFGGLDVLVNNAGIQAKGSAHETDVAVFDRILAVNLRGAYLCARAALRRWIGADGRTLRTAERPGVIVNVSSVHERIPRPDFVSYAVSKFGLKGLTQSLALEYASRHVRVNAIGPGATSTPINDAWRHDPALSQIVADHVPMKRVAEPEEIARMIAMLASDAAPYMTGQTVFVDGGLTLYPAFQEAWSG